MFEIITGKSNSGKTHYLISILNTELKRKYQFIWIICPTFSHNRTWQAWKHKDDPGVYILEVDQDDVNYTLERVTQRHRKKAVGKSLVILDDCASSKRLKSKTQELTKLSFSGRHYGIDTIVLTQQLSSVAKCQRENATRIVTFYNPCKLDNKIIVDNYIDESEDYAAIRRQLRATPYAKLVINLEYPFEHTLVK